MTKRSKQLKIGAYFDNHGGHAAAWRHPSVTPASAMKLSYWQNLARICEKARLDFVFLADTNRVQHLNNPLAMRQSAPTAFFEPLTMLSALAATTERLGLVATMSTTYNQPYSVARLFGSLDRLSEGRASWNVVTSSSSAEAPNFQADAHLNHDDRYKRAKEFLTIVQGLWDSWEDNSFIFDQETGAYLDEKKMHYLNYQSEMFSVRGPLNVPRSVQGRPVIFQAGSSDIGREFGAEMADALFTAQSTLEKAQEFYSDVKTRMATYNREPDDIAIFVGVGPIVGRTMAEAEDKFDQLQNLLAPDVALQLLSEVLAADLTTLPPDEPVTDLPASDGMQSRRDLLLDKARKEQMTLVDLARFVAAGRGHRQIIGTPTTIADNFQQWFEEGAADGFLLAASHLPEGMQDFAELVIPELQRRGIFRTEYEGTTLRENLGLRQPIHPFTC